MKLGNRFLGAAFSAGLLLSSIQSAHAVNDIPPIEPAASQQDDEFLQIHNTMRQDVSIYARDVFVGHILSPTGRINTLAQRGLTSLVTQSYARTSVEPAGVVGIDLNDPNTLSNLSLISGFLYFPITNDTQRLSVEARHALQDYIAGGGVIILDVVDGSRINNSAPLRQIMDDLQIRPPERLQEGHALTQSFYFSELEGANQNADVWIERNADNLGEAGASSVIIADQNWARTWYPETAEAEEHERAIRAGLNILVYALTGLYKNDSIHQETLDQKREYLEEEEQRLRSEEASPAAE